MWRSAETIGLALLLLVGASGCGQQDVQAISTKGDETRTIDRAKYVLRAEPDGAVGVMIAREDAKDQDEIVLVGRIGGRKNPWIEGRAAFMMIDASMSIVSDGQETEAGQVCMDDCCASLRADCTTLVKVVDDRGQVLATDARELLGAVANDMVVVKGKVRRDDEGSFSVIASGVYVRR